MNKPTEKMIEAGYDAFCKFSGLSNREIVERVLSAALAVEAGTGNPMSFFSENVDRWGAAEWFDRLANAIREQDKACVAKDGISLETYRMIAASSAMTLVRNHEAAVRSALTASPASSGVEGVEIDEEALDRAAREGYAVRCKTHGPRTLAQYASQDIMDRQLADARVIVAAYLSAPSLSAGAGGEQ